MKKTIALLLVCLTLFGCSTNKERVCSLGNTEYAITATASAVHYQKIKYGKKYGEIVKRPVQEYRDIDGVKSYSYQAEGKTEVLYVSKDRLYFSTQLKNGHMSRKTYFQCS